jgi:hypothetical protein
MDTDVSHEVERRLTRLEEKVGVSNEEEEVSEEEDDEEDEEE